MAAASPIDALPDIIDDPNLRDVQKTLIDLRGKLAQLRVTFTPNHPEVRRVQAEITNLETTFQSQRTNILTRIRNELLAAQRRENLLNTSYTTQAGKVSEQSAKAAHYQLLKRDVDANRLLYDTMLQKAQGSEHRFRSERQQHPRRRSGRASLTPYKPDVPQRVTVGLLSGIFLGIVLVVLRERADRTLQDPGDPAFYLGLPELWALCRSVIRNRFSLPAAGGNKISG